MPLPKVVVSAGGNHGTCHLHRGPNGEIPPPELLAPSGGTPHRVCQNVIFCGGQGDVRCNPALVCGPSGVGCGPASCAACSAVNNILCELPYTPPPPDAPLVDKKLAMKYTEDTSSCPGLPLPSNTRLENLIPSSTGTPYSSANWFLACRKPKSSDGLKNIISNIDTRTIPARTEGIILNFHYFCGKFNNSYQCMSVVSFMLFDTRWSRSSCLQYHSVSCQDFS